MGRGGRLRVLEAVEVWVCGQLLIVLVDEAHGADEAPAQRCVCTARTQEWVQYAGISVVDTRDRCMALTRRALLTAGLSRGRSINMMKMSRLHTQNMSSVLKAASFLVLRSTLFGRPRYSHGTRKRAPSKDGMRSLARVWKHGHRPYANPGCCLHSRCTS
jgi:hypothetical protein